MHSPAQSGTADNMASGTPTMDLEAPVVINEGTEAIDPIEANKVNEHLKPVELETKAADDNQSKIHESATLDQPKKASTITPAPITEMLIFFGPECLMARPIEPGSQAPRKAIQLSDICKYYHTVETFVFDDPYAFLQLFDNTSRENPVPGLLITRNAVTKVRLVLFPFIGPQRLPTGFDWLREELHAQIAENYSDWRAACRALPNGHNITNAMFDVTKPKWIHEEIRYPSLEIPLIQNLSTIFAMKARGSFCSRLCGYENDKQRGAFVENCLVSVEGSPLDDEPRRWRI